MFVQFNKLRFKNILSYGNNFTEIDFSNGINLIRAPNGSGKSTILDALNFVLFGKPFRNIKLNRLINRINEKNLVTEIEFNIGFDKWKIVRGLKPTVFEIYKNDQVLDKLSSKKLNQAEIDKLLGINQKLFKNIVGVAVTNNKPFLSMPIWEKRELIENIFNIDVLAEMSKEVKRRKTLEQSEEKLKITESSALEKQINDNKKYITDMTQYIANFNTNNENDKANIVARIDELNKIILKNQKNIKVATDKIIELQEKTKVEPDTNAYSKIIKSLGVSENEKKRIQKTLDQLKDNPLCPMCGSELSGEHAKKHIKELTEEIDRLTNIVIPKLKSEEDAYKALKKEYDSNIAMIRNIEMRKSQEELSLNNSNGEINQCNKKLEEIDKRQCPFNLDEYKEKVKILNEQLDELKKVIKGLTHQIEIDKELIDILGDDGIKVYFFRKLIPILNQNINSYLKKFELPICLEFDEQMQETIINGRSDMEYDQFSGGEKTRIDMSVLLSFFNISRIISNWSCNLLFIDEILDAQVDKNGIEQFLVTLYNIVSDNEKKLGIYLVSHKIDDVKIEINKTIEIKKKGLFSELEVK